MMRTVFGLTDFPFLKDVDKIFWSKQLEYLHDRFSHCLETQSIALLTGEIGSGKTTFTRHFLNSLNHNCYKVFYLTGTMRSARSFFRGLAMELGLPAGYLLENLTRQVKSQLMDIAQKQRLYPILVIDEAQNLNDSILEEIRLLTNFKMDSRNYLTIFLLGHPVLRARLKLPPYAAFKQRISFAYHLTGLELSEAPDYLLHRLGCVGGKSQLFSADAVKLIFNYSRGLPRIINSLAHEALYLGALNKVSAIEESLIQEIIQKMDVL